MTELVRVVDSHIHLGPPKYAPVESYLTAMGDDQIFGAVLVQHLGNTDNSYLDAVRAGHPHLFAALALVDSVDDVAGVLADGFVGLRVAPVGLPGPNGRDVFDVLDHFAAAVSVTGPFEDVTGTEFRAIVRAHPRVRFRIEHVGGFRYGSSEVERAAFGRLIRLADEPNVTLMWSGFFLNGGTVYPYPNTHAYLRAALAAYGSERIMWSGDWNRAGLGGGDYRRARDLIDLVVEDPRQRADILAGTAARVFGLSGDMGYDTTAPGASWGS